MRPSLHYDYLFHHVCEAVATDPAWERWWAAGGVPRLELQVFLDGAGEETPLPDGEAYLPDELLTLAQRKGYLDLADIQRFLPG
jgi:hypothetical protein